MRRTMYPAVALASALALSGAEPISLTEPAAHANPPGQTAISPGSTTSAVDSPSDPMRTVRLSANSPQFGIPATVLDSYRRSAMAMATSDPSCHLSWTLLAGIGKVESDHAENGDVSSNGDVLRPILGPALNGSQATAAVPNTVGPQWDQSGAWARAVGPMQFLPSTWQRWGADGNGDGTANPENVYDASLAAARYLCSGGGDLSTPTGQYNAIFSYNHSAQYVETVEQWMRVYQNGGVPVPDQPGAAEFTWFTPPSSTGQSETVRPSSDASTTSRPSHSAPRPASPSPSPSPVSRQPRPAPTPPTPIVPVIGPVVSTVGQVVLPVTKPLASVSAVLAPVNSLQGALPSLLP
ncbi:lytic murein transglycosylase [Streptomyces sp. RB6PN25]|uniref:Lytic murein transglycosylase n=1 Tax=Streptomyces humicola TaxID=2953240 RepID=A0ABT1PNH0_9ACTN|nr:lytic murein transglycosylase [Streptomyces humicola]MCQ4079227.1 lytic murein transglycosylase [Streptomyces humicola]